MSKYLWNNRIRTSVLVEDDFSSISWDVEEPASGVTVIIEAAENGFILSTGGSIPKTRYIADGYWGLTKRLEALLMNHRHYSEVFDPEDYDADGLAKAGYVKAPEDAV